jgi:hypothetical protein
MRIHEALEISTSKTRQTLTGFVPENPKRGPKAMEISGVIEAGDVVGHGQFGNAVVFLLRSNDQRRIRSRLATRASNLFVQGLTMTSSTRLPRWRTGCYWCGKP